LITWTIFWSCFRTVLQDLSRCPATTMVEAARWPLRFRVADREALEVEAPAGKISPKSGS
jgi:hypothetical protein